MPDQPVRIFISYAREDTSYLHELETHLANLHRQGRVVTWNDRALEAGDVWEPILLAELRAADVILMLVSASFMASDYIHQVELKEAFTRLARGDVRIVPLLIRPVDLEGSQLDRLQTLPSDGRPISSWRNRDEAWLQVVEGLRRVLPGYRKSQSSPGHAPQTLSVPLKFRPQRPPPGFIPRLEEEGKLIEALLESGTEGSSRPVAISAALRGAGGFGKTTLAQVLCHDPRVREAYGDQVWWITLGEEAGPGVPGKVDDLVFALTGTRSGATRLDEVGRALEEALGDRRMLLVIDDVWRELDLRPWLAGGPRCQRLVTTRNADVLRGRSDVSFQEVPVDAMQVGEATALLSSRLETWLEPGALEQAGPELQRLTGRLGEWPLLLELANGELRERVALGESLADAVAGLHTEYDELGIEAFDRAEEGERNDAVGKSLQLSLRRLSEEERARYQELAVFPEDVEVPLEVVARLWHQTGGLSPAAAQKLYRRLHDLSLLQGLDLGKRGLRIHDVFRAWMVHHRRAELPALHAVLVDGCRPADGWVNLPKDAGYLWRHAGWHLAQARRLEDLRAVLGDFRWVADKLEATDPHAVIADYERLPEPEPLRLTGEALRLASHVLSRDPAQLPGQLIGRLATRKEVGIGQLLEQAGRWRRSPWLRPLLPTLSQAGGPLLRTLEGHTDGVTSVALLTDGRVVSVSQDRTLKVWDLARGECLYTLEGHTDGLTSVTVLVDGRVVSGSWDRTLKVWDPARGECLRTLEGHTGVVTSVAVLADGRVVSGSSDHTLKVWDLARGECLCTLEGHTRAVTSVAVLVDGRVVSSSDDKTVKVWDLAVGECHRTLTGHSDWVTSVAVLANDLIVTSANDKMIKVWELALGECQRTLKSRTRSVTSVAVFKDGRVVSGFDDNVLKVWDLAWRKCLRTLEGHTGAVRSVAVLGDSRVISGSDDHTLKVWDLSRQRHLRPIETHTGAVNSVAVLADGRVVSGSDDSTLKIWHMPRGECQRTLRGHGGSLSSVAVLADGRIVSGSSNGTLRFWDPARDEYLFALAGHTRYVTSVAAFSEERVVTGSWDRTLKVWDLARGECLRTLKGHTDRVTSVVVLANGQVVSGSSDHTLKVWDLTQGECLRTLEGHCSAVTSVAVLVDGRVVSGSSDHTLKVWDLTRGECLGTLEEHTAAVTSVAVLADGRVVSCSVDRTLKVWDLATGECLACFTVEGALGAVAVLPDGRIVTGGSGGQLHVLRLEVPAPALESRPASPATSATPKP